MLEVQCPCSGQGLQKIMTRPLRNSQPKPLQRLRLSKEEANTPGALYRKTGMGRLGMIRFPKMMPVEDVHGESNDREGSMGCLRRLADALGQNMLWFRTTPNTAPVRNQQGHSAPVTILASAENATMW